MKKLVAAASLFALAISVGLAAQVVKGVTVHQLDKTVDFSAFKTYSWGPSHRAIDASVDKIITAAIEEQLAARGLTKGSPGAIVVGYHTVQRTDVDLKTFDDKAPAAGAERTPATTIRVGTLLVDVRDASTNKVLWRASVERALANMPVDQRDAYLKSTVASIFQMYPVAAKK